MGGGGHNLLTLTNLDRLFLAVTGGMSSPDESETSCFKKITKNDGGRGENGEKHKVK